MTVIDDQRKQHKNGQKDYKRPKKNDQKTNKTTRTTIIQNYQKEQTKITINETDKNAQRPLKEPSESLHLTRGITLPFFPQPSSRISHFFNRKG